jgi:DNA-binding transcriptional LysR family regulator
MLRESCSALPRRRRGGSVNRVMSVLSDLKSTPLRTIIPIYCLDASHKFYLCYHAPMELSQLKYFVAIAETLSYTEAAELVHVSQPALSYQMRRLEAELAVKLFVRQGRGIALTGDGELFLPMAQGVISRAKEAVRVVRDHSGVDAGEVCMGVAPSVATYLVPDLLAEFHQVFPRVRVDMVEGGDLELQQRVFTGSMDFAVLGDAGSPQTHDITPLGSEDLLVVVAPTHRLAEQVLIDLTELRNDDWVFPARSYRLVTQVIQACQRAAFEPNTAYQAGSLETLKNLVRVGLGVSVLPSIALTGAGREGLATLRVKEGLKRELFLISARERDLTRAAQVLMTHVRAGVTHNLSYPPRGEHPPAAGAPAAPPETDGAR